MYNWFKRQILLLTEVWTGCLRIPKTASIMQGPVSSNKQAPVKPLFFPQPLSQQKLTGITANSLHSALGCDKRGPNNDATISWGPKTISVAEMLNWWAVHSPSHYLIPKDIYGLLSLVLLFFSSQLRVPSCGVSGMLLLFFPLADNKTLRHMEAIALKA